MMVLWPGSSDLVKPQTKWIDQKMWPTSHPVALGHLQSDVIKDELIPSIVGSQAVGDGQLAAGFPLGRAEL